jgi:cytoplasmic iron level regulating protein YaaA (DUF328/UPF0246 family)
VALVSGSMFLLVPPSLGQAPVARALNGAGTFDASLHDAREEVRQALADSLSQPREKLERLYGARGELLERSLLANRELVDGTAATTAAWRRFSGVVWTHLEPQSLNTAQRARLLVPSAYYGIVNANDPIGEYRLGFANSLVPLGNLATFWRRHLRQPLCELLGNNTVVNLLPGEHELAIDFSALSDVARVKRVHFVAFDGDRSMGHDAKAAKGHVARALLRGGWSALKEFEWNGWNAQVRGDTAEVRAPKVRVVA